MTNLPPSGAGALAETYPEVWDSYGALGKACAESGPLAADVRRLVKLALAIGARSEGAVHSHSRRGLEEGVNPEALRQVAILAIPTLGLPAAVAGMAWINDNIKARD